MTSEHRSKSRSHDSEIEQFRLLVEQIQDYAIYMMDPGGRVTTWNSGAERIKGYTASDIIGCHYSTFFLPEDVAAGKPDEILEVAMRDGKAEQEGWRVRKDGSRFWASALVTAIRGRSGELLGFSKITRDATERMRYEEALKNTQAELVQSEHSLRQLSLQLLKAQDEERRRIGREMHDSLGQYLSVLKMKVRLLLAKNPSLNENARQQAEECAALLSDCINEVRTLSYMLYPPMLEERGLKTAIEWYLDGLSHRSGIRVNFVAPDWLERPSPDVELALFRVLQESLTNVLKHSGSSVIDIELSDENGMIGLKVRDYGKGPPDDRGSVADNSVWDCAV